MVTNNSKSLHNIRGIISEWTFSGKRLYGFETPISIDYMGKSETEYDNNMRCSKYIISHYLSAHIIFNLGTVHYNKGNELENVLLISDYTSFFAEKNPQLTEEEF